VNERTQSPPVATAIVTPVALSTSVVHAPDETLAALTDVETNATVVETMSEDKQMSGEINRRNIMRTLCL
jgi:hypothetical protein